MPLSLVTTLSWRWVSRGGLGFQSPGMCMLEEVFHLVIEVLSHVRLSALKREL